MPETRLSTASLLHLTLEGADCGFLKSCEGGTMTAEIVAEPGPEHYVVKHLGPAAPEPLQLSVGIGMGKELYDWIAAAWSGIPERRSGEITFADAMGQARTSLSFTNALISEVTFPALDGSSKDAAYLGLTLEPESTQRQKASGKLAAATAAKSARWLASNFRVEIEGLDAKRVSRVESFTVVPRTGEEARIDYPNLTFTLAEAGSEEWVAWHEASLGRRKDPDEQERRGAIALLDPTLQELGRVELDGLGIYRIGPKTSGAADAVALVVANLYCERMGLAL